MAACVVKVDSGLCQDHIPWDTASHIVEPRVGMLSLLHHCKVSAKEGLKTWVSYYNQLPWW